MVSIQIATMSMIERNRSGEDYREVIAKGIQAIEGASWLGNNDISPLHCRSRASINPEKYRPVVSPVHVKRIEALLVKYDILLTKILGAGGGPTGSGEGTKPSQTPQSQLRRRQSLKISRDLRYIADVAKTPTRVRVQVQGTPLSHRRRSAGSSLERHTPSSQLFPSPTKRPTTSSITSRTYTDTMSLLTLLRNAVSNCSETIPCSILDSTFPCDVDQLLPVDTDDFAAGTLSVGTEQPIGGSFDVQADRKCGGCVVVDENRPNEGVRHRGGEGSVACDEAWNTCSDILSEIDFLMVAQNF